MILDPTNLSAGCGPGTDDVWYYVKSISYKNSVRFLACITLQWMLVKTDLILPQTAKISCSLLTWKAVVEKSNINHRAITVTFCIRIANKILIGKNFWILCDFINFKHNFNCTKSFLVVSKLFKLPLARKLNGKISNHRLKFLLISISSN